MSTDNSTTNVFDALTEYGFRKWRGYLNAQLVAAGFVQTADTGQLTFTAAYAWQTKGDGTQFSPTAGSLLSNVFDGNTGTTFASNVTPGAGAASVNINFDLGTGVSNTAATYKIYMNGTTGDPSTWTLQGSNDFSAWTTLDTQTGISVVAGFQTYTISSPAAFRYHRLVITASRGAIALSLFEWQLITAGAVNFAVYTQSPNVGNNATAIIGYEIYRFGDTLQSTAPCFIKIEYWNNGGTTTGLPSHWISLATSTDGAGNLTGLGVTARTNVTSTSVQFTNLVTPTLRNVCSGTGGKRFAISLGYNGTSGVFFAFERIKDNTGADTGNGVVFVEGGTSLSTPVTMVMAAVGPSPTSDAYINSLVPTATTGVGGTTNALYEIVSFLGARNPTFISALTYYNTNYTQEVTITTTIFGVSHTYFPIGNNISGTVRGIAAIAIAILYE